MLILGAVCSCSKEGDSRNGGDGVFTLRASLPEEALKTTLGPKVSDTYPVFWSTGDQISVNGKLSNAVASTDDGKKCVDFTIEDPLSSPYNVLYPGTTSTNAVVFPTTQNYVVNSFDGSAAPAYGTAEMKGKVAVASLNPLGTVLRFAFTGNTAISKIVLSTVGGQSITGKFKVNFSTGALTANGTNSDSVTYNAGDVTLGGSDTYFHIVVPARAYGEGFEALVYEKDTEKYMRLKFFGEGKTLAAGTVIELESKAFVAGRVEEVAQIGDFTAETGGTPEKKANFTVATYNILSSYDNGRNKEIFKLSNCATQLGKCVKATGADIICFNEIDETFATSSTNSIQKIAEAQGLTGYSWYIKNPNKVSHEWTSYDKEYTWANGFAFNSAVFEYVGGNYYWFNKNGGYVGNKADAYDSHLSKYRTLVYAKLKHKASGKTFNLIVTHMPLSGDDNSDEKGLAKGVAHNYAATAIKKFIADTDASGSWILCGDLNAFKSTTKYTCANETGYNSLKEKFVDSYEQVVTVDGNADYYKTYSGTQSGSSYYYTWQQYSSNHPERQIDHIMYCGGFKPESYKTIRLTYYFDDGTVHADNENNLWCPSDHLPVVVNFTLN